MISEPESLESLVLFLRGAFCSLAEVGLCADRICHAPVSVSGLFEL